MEPASILLVTTDAETATAVHRLAVATGSTLRVTGTLRGAAKAMARHDVDAVLVQVDAPGAHVRRDLNARAILPTQTPVLAVARQASIADAVLSTRAGAVDYVALPLRDTCRLADAIERATRAAPSAAGPDAPLRGLVTADRRMLAVCQTLERVADSDVTVAICGEAGTGRSTLAAALHAGSRRRLGPLVEVSCGGLSEAQAEAELFGRPPDSDGARGAERRGALECADGGTLVVGGLRRPGAGLLDAVLAGAQMGEFVSPGGGRRVRSSLRLVLTGGAAPAGGGGATAAVPVQVDVPPLRERVQDVPLLARHFLRLGAMANGSAPQISADALGLLVRYRWPGNVRELKGAMDRAAPLARRGVIGPGSLPEAVTAASTGRRPREGVRRPVSLKAAMRRPERLYILRALRACGWSKRRAAQRLQISRSTLYKKIREHGLAREIARASRKAAAGSNVEIGVGNRA